MAHSLLHKITICLGTATTAVALLAGSAAISYYTFANEDSLYLFEDKVAKSLNNDEIDFDNIPVSEDAIDVSAGITIENPSDEQLEEIFGEEEENKEINVRDYERQERIDKAGSAYDADVAQSMGISSQDPVFDIGYTPIEKVGVGIKESFANINMSDPVLVAAASGSWVQNATIKGPWDIIAFNKKTGILRYYGSLPKIKANGGGTQIGNSWQAFSSIHTLDWNGDNIYDLVGHNGNKVMLYAGVKGGGFARPVQILTAGYSGQISKIGFGKGVSTSSKNSLFVLYDNGNLGVFDDLEGYNKVNWIARGLESKKYNMAIGKSSNFSGSNPRKTDEIILTPIKEPVAPKKEKPIMYLSLTQKTNKKSEDIKEFVDLAKPYQKSLYMPRVSTYLGFEKGAASNKVDYIFTDTTATKVEGELYYAYHKPGGGLHSQKIGTYGWTDMVIANGSSNY